MDFKVNAGNQVPDTWSDDKKTKNFDGNDILRGQIIHLEVNMDN
jgi:hypothetical protein